MKTKRAGALLFAIITAFVLTLVVSTIVILTTNQFRIIDNEVDRIRAFYRAQAGIEYAIWNIRNSIGPFPLAGQQLEWQIRDINNNVLVTIVITNPAPVPPGGTYSIRARVNY